MSITEDIVGTPGLQIPVGILELILILAAPFALGSCCPADASPTQTDGGKSGATNIRADARAVDSAASPKSDPRWDALFLGEWLIKQEYGLPMHEDKFLHFIYDEWFEDGHIRVSLRGNDIYVIEVDGIWHSQTLRKSGGFFSGKGIFPFLNYFVDFDGLPSRPDTVFKYPSYPPCSEAPRNTPSVGKDFRASVTLVAEFARLAVFHSEWRSPYCSGFPHELAKESWKLVEKVTKKAVVAPPWHAAPEEPGQEHWPPLHGR
jgi:hypothetical protein